MLRDDEKRRYARHILLDNIGINGQTTLSSSHILMIGAGGLGASALSYLAACGIGTISIMDDDVVELSNLNRQIIHETGDIGRPKIASAADRISELNPHVAVRTHQCRFTGDEDLSSYDLILDGSDNFNTRFALNDAALRQKKPWIYCALRGFDGQLSCFSPAHNTPCYRCLVPAEPHGRHSCDERGVLGALVGVMGSIMAVEAIKCLLATGTSYHNKLLRYDGLNGRWNTSALLHDPSCISCS